MDFFSINLELGPEFTVGLGRVVSEQRAANEMAEGDIDLREATEESPQPCLEVRKG